MKPILSFMVFLSYRQILITLEDWYKNVFVIDLGVFVWIVMSFGMNNKPPTYRYVVSKSFHEYINLFMKIFLDNHCFQQYGYSFGQFMTLFSQVS
jgi:hypothetical protein